ncbi:hypothetical protein J2T13_004970 [Paenibacillus sp. DS2015]|uniref:hypothetical protein n=1 Tax=Paenibacillus sp. DS2015 TaxID=3373917 RepID=UPI003D196A57
MLADAERKLLRVLYNYSKRHNVIPTIGDLERLTGRYRNGIWESLITLRSLGYIYWEDKASMNSIQIIEGWEKEPNKSVVPSSSSRENINYWT